MISTLLPGPPSWQVIYIPDEDSTFRLIGIRNYPLAASRYGILALLGHWLPRLWLKWVTEEKAFVIARRGFVVIPQFSSGRAC